MHPSFSQLFVIWAHRPQTTVPLAVTRPSSETFTYCSQQLFREGLVDKVVYVPDTRRLEYARKNLSQRRQVSYLDSCSFSEDP
jgi:hypothetical protein